MHSGRLEAHQDAMIVLKEEASVKNIGDTLLSMTTGCLSQRIARVREKVKEEENLRSLSGKAGQRNTLAVMDISVVPKDMRRK